MTSEASTLTIDLDIDDRGVDLAGRLNVEARGNRLIVTLEAESRSRSHTNRTGLVVLHPPSLAGEPLQVRHADGEVERLRFPVAISPHQPARGIASLAWCDHSIALRVDLEGDEFEMEDQRNWSDASYKTYNRSLDRPFPYTLEPGERIRQRVTVVADASDSPTAPAPAGPARVETLRLTASGSLPTIAIGAATAPGPGPKAHDPVAAHRHVELDLRDPSWPAALERALLGAEDLSVMVVSPSPPQRSHIERVAQGLTGAHVRWVGIVDTDSHVSDSQLVTALREALPPRTPIVGGSRSHYTELNRQWDRVDTTYLDGLVFPTTPLFHTLETEQLVEAVAMQRVIAENATSRAPDLPVHIGPVTLRPRFNNVATSAAPTPVRTDLAEGYGAQLTGADDARQSAPELAAWTVASAAALALPGVGSLTYFEEWGPRGIRTTEGTPLPVHAALAAVAELDEGVLLSGTSADGVLWAMGSRSRGTDTILVANLSGRPRTVRLAADGAPTREADLDAFDWTRLRVQAAGRS
ncbi:MULTISPECIES: hypothetical protein [unclassified Brachybacterium]|uniref:hypothetical protein n=1 Tax=unclassified Brachybacterium TaxID=2623841 RepID=UPI00361E0853